jgi:myo-inositol 2-dehydrogenase/D-chiro-inositol 1-dehydrogenase
MTTETKPTIELPESNRRNFLRAAAVSATAAALPIELCAQVAGSDTIKLALIGCGGRGGGAAKQNLSSKDGNVKLVALADASGSRLEGTLNSLRGSHPDKVDVKDANKFVGLDAYGHAINEADMVILATPPGFRPRHFKAAVEAGKHIFSEKPTNVDAVGARIYHEAAQLADTKNLKVVVGLQRHYQDVYLQTLAQVKAGLIGDIQSGQVYWNGNTPWVKNRTPGQTEMEYQINNWYFFTWLCGDHIVEQHVHNIDVFNWFLSEALGAPNDKPVHPISAQGMGGRQVRTGLEFGQIYDHHYVEYTYPNGVVLNSQCRHQPNTYQNVSETIIGTKGICYPARGVIKDRDGKTLWSFKQEDSPDPYQTEHDFLHRAIKTNTPVNNAYYGNVSSFTAVLGRMATYSGKQIKWDDAWNSNKTDYPDNLAWDAPCKVNPDKDGRYPIAIPGVTEVV